MIRVRFAPSPTGRLHAGNAFVALANKLFALRHGGEFLLRLDDTDVERSSADHAKAIEDDLAWLGLTWDAFARQSERGAEYAAAVVRLKASGRLYPCFETPDELEAKRRDQQRRHLPPIYDRAALSLPEAERARLLAEGQRPHWRFLLNRETARWDDLVRGPQAIDEASQSDPILVRADGSYLYTLPSVLDDIALGVTHVIRGNDHVTNTGTQIQLFVALGAAPPAFAHLPLLADAEGGPLSKRLGGLSLEELRGAGVEALALAAYLARLGTGEPMEPVASLPDLATGFDLARFGRGSPRFDRRDLMRLNARLLHGLPFEAVAQHLAALGLGDIDPALWEAVRGNVETLAGLSEWRQVCRGPLAPVIEDQALVAEARRLLPPEPWTDATWAALTGAVAAATGRKGKALYHPLRLALTGRDHGPEMRNLLPLIGRERALARLGGQTA